MRTISNKQPNRVSVRSRFSVLGTRLLFLTLVLFCTQGQAAEFHLVTGGFNVAATSGTRTGSIMNLGAYHAAYERRIVTGIEFTIGYTILVSGFVAGDMSYGLDLGINYYPLSDSEPYEYRDQSHLITTTDLWRPYIGLYFSQRQFQAVQTGYAGGGAAIGVERALGDSYAIKFLVRHLIFAGSNSATATETTVLAGITISY